ncbi:MAG TPA: SDR family NAD(P)-dependent oxidoreductase [Bacteroidales bacterium]|nr:SDR family NAD(P)-dependent oxidoreductase [Bacteroidales bacterium]
MNVIITGTTQGIGKSLLLTLLKKKEVEIIAINRSEMDYLNLLSGADRGRITPILFDLKDINETSNLLQLIPKDKLAIDVLINNAGFLVNKPFNEITKEDLLNSYTINVFAPFLLIRQLLPILNKGAHIVNIISMGGVQGSSKYPGLSAYSSSKGALAILTECLSVELGVHDIKVNAIAPGAVDTEMLRKAFPGYQAPVNTETISEFIAHFALNGHKVMNGKTVELALSNP